MNYITIELSKEDRERLDQLNANIKALIFTGVEKTEPMPESEPGETVLPVEKPETETVETVNFDALRAEFRKRSLALSNASPDKKSKVKEIISRYAENISGIPNDSCLEALAALAELEG